MSNKKSSIEWLVEKYNYITWLRNRDEISPLKADEWRIKYFEQAKEMHKYEIIEAFSLGDNQQVFENEAIDYYNTTFVK